MEAISISVLIFTVYALSVLAYCLVRKNDINIVRVIYINSLLLYGLIMITLHMLPIDINQQRGFNYIPFAKFSDNAKLGSYILTSIYAVIIFIPLGFFTSMQCKLMAARRTVLYAVMLGLLVSLIIEVAQLYLPFNRICDVDEILFNVLGSFLGAVLFTAVSSKKLMLNIMRKILYY